MTRSFHKQKKSGQRKPASPESDIIDSNSMNTQRATHTPPHVSDPIALAWRASCDSLLQMARVLLLKQKRAHHEWRIMERVLADDHDVRRIFLASAFCAIVTAWRDRPEAINPRGETLRLSSSRLGAQDCQKIYGYLTMDAASWDDFERFVCDHTQAQSDLAW